MTEAEFNTEIDNLGFMNITKPGSFLYKFRRIADNKLVAFSTGQVMTYEAQLEELKKH